MKLVAYEYQGAPGLGLVTEDGQSVRPLAVAHPERGALDVIAEPALLQRLVASAAAALPLSQVSLRAPLPRPARNIFCVGRNYHEHANELAGSIFQGSTVDEWPIIFSKVPESVVGPFAAVTLPTDVSSDIDYEAEIAVVIGRQGRNISRENAMAHVFGLTIVNDVTARDVQMRHKQWLLGKSFDTFCPMGPWIVTIDELDVGNLDIRCLVNGEARQSSNTRAMIFDIPAIIEHCSRGITLYPGDVIATGTPAGVGMGMNPPRYLKDGDIVRIEVDGIGHIENRFTV